MEWPIGVQVTSTAPDRLIVLKGPARGPPNSGKAAVPRDQALTLLVILFSRKE